MMLPLHNQQRLLRRNNRASRLHACHTNALKWDGVESVADLTSTPAALLTTT